MRALTTLTRKGPGLFTALPAQTIRTPSAWLDPVYAASLDLHNFTQKRKEIGFGNNAILFAALEAVTKHGIEKHPDLHIFGTEFWLTKIHSDYHDLNWGQSPLAFPPCIRKILHKLFPMHSDEKPISWFQYLQLREEVITRLKKLGVNVHFGEPEVSEEEGRRTIKCGEGLVSVEPGELCHVYNTLRAPVEHHDLFDGVCIKSSTELYRHPREEMRGRNIFNLGGGRTTVWLAQHFNETRFTTVALTDELALFPGEAKPKNINVHSLDQFRRFFQIVHGDSRSVSDVIGEAFDGAVASLGFTLRSDLTKGFEDVVTVVDGSKASSWTACAGVPTGGLAQSYKSFLAATGNHSHDPRGFHADDYRKQLMDLLEKADLKSAPVDKFLSHLREAMRAKVVPENTSKLRELYAMCCSKLDDGSVPSSLIESFTRLVLDDFDRLHVETPVDGIGFKP